MRRALRLKNTFGAEAAGEKCCLLNALNKSTLTRASEVVRLHDLLCYLRAYPDTQEVLTTVERTLTNFHRRKDLRQFSKELADSGIAGTDIYYQFYWSTALWLVQRWPKSIFIAWEDFDNESMLEEVWPLIFPDADTWALEDTTLTTREWIRIMKTRDQTDAAFIIERFLAWKVDPETREKVYEDIGLPLRLKSGANTPSRTGYIYQYSPIQFQHSPIRRQEFPPGIIKTKPTSWIEFSPAKGQQLVDLARVQMITRSRDLYAFMHADKNDVRIAEFSEGLQFVCYGVKPAHRYMFESLYVFLILKNGVPVGYTQASCLLQSAEVNFNIFADFRGVETGRIFMTTLSLIRQMFGATAFIINPQQLGTDNPEALKSGAFWFYHKYGFRPRQKQTRKIVNRETKARANHPTHRSSIATLRMLARDYVYLYTGQPRSQVISGLPMQNLAIACARTLTREFGSDRERAVQHCAKKAADLLGLQSLVSLSREERGAWDRWSPLVLAIPRIAKWNHANKEALVAVIKAKGGRRESDFVMLFDHHFPLRRAVLKLAESKQEIK